MVLSIMNFGSDLLFYGLENKIDDFTEG